MTNMKLDVLAPNHFRPLPPPQVGNNFLF